MTYCVYDDRQRSMRNKRVPSVITVTDKNEHSFIRDDHSFIRDDQIDDQNRLLTSMFTIFDRRKK